MTRALRVCPALGCPELVQSGPCAAHRRQADRRRGTRQQRGYGAEHEHRFRRGVLRRDPLCVCDGTHCQHRPGLCYTASTVADHWPRDKRELRALGLDEHDPRYGRGLCKACHDRHTAHAQPGGWHAR